MGFAQIKEVVTQYGEITCANCGIVFYVPEQYRVKLVETHQGFYCPNGHPLVYNGKTKAEKEAERLRKELEWTEARAKRNENALEIEKRSKAALKGQMTKLKKRVANGVCPCCNRTFSNLAAHMKGQHPQWVDEHPEIMDEAPKRRGRPRKGGG